MGKEIVQTDKAPKAVGPYSQAVRVGQLLFCSGQIPLDPTSGQMVGESVEQQTTQVMNNIRGLLESTGLGLHSIVKSTIFIKNMGDFAKVNEVYSSFLKQPYPARSTVEVSELPKGALIEIECIASFS
jgi:2-iminobutanoate/2-iminopropanoate deaminase